MASSFEILGAVVALLVAIYYYCNSNYDYWKNRGVKGPKPIPFLGNFKDIMLSRISIGSYMQQIYNEFKDEPMVGLFARATPILSIHDPNFIKDILIKDFSKFSDRPIKVHEKTEPISQHLFALETKRWRPMRLRLSPIFTSGKLKEMFPLILESSEHLENYLAKVVPKNESIEFRELTARYTTDVIGTCAFGLELNALEDENCEFRRMGRDFFTMTFSKYLRLRIREAFPNFYDFLGYILPEVKNQKYFRLSIAQTMAYRRKHNIVRHDFIDILLDIQDNSEKFKDFEITETLLAAQAFVFFLAGFETSSSTMSNALYELAQNHEIQDKMRAEINEMKEKNKGQWKYDDIKQMSYLDMIFRETLRKYPPVTVLMRRAVSDYTFNGTKVTIPKGTRVFIPAFAIHRDPKIYPDPDKYDPERFSEESSAGRNPMYYLPFGDGPRNCIGARFAVYQTKIGLIKILSNYKVEVCEETQIPYKIDETAFILTPLGGIHLKLVDIKS
ncbi:cytochrome P450 6a2-like [Prorops nasuta]|uniref:cytochrome P450 6a2-like n=1 Tax=Prorops nasuta TaxID=863751 RepID=UPI0034CF7263